MAQTQTGNALTHRKLLIFYEENFKLSKDLKAITELEYTTYILGLIIFQNTPSPKD